jgi:diaminopimelate epimerase
MKINFTKYQGTGNDFIIIDNRTKKIKLSKLQIAELCNRRFGIGADGLMLLEKEKGYDFKMVYFNADGGESTMCGNGGRCLVAFAHAVGIKKDKYHFLAIDGAHEATIKKNNWVALKMNDVHQITKQGKDFVLNTGSPHYIQAQKKLDQFDVFTNGKKIRNSTNFKKEGINVNFIEKTDSKNIFVRTYERGVEDETYSCGTGVTAAAIVNNYQEGNNTIQIKTLGGALAVSYKKTKDHFSNVWLHGPATFVYHGKVTL